jgi:hypothetical protein
METKQQLIDFLQWFNTNVQTIDQSQPIEVWVDAYLKKDKA